MTVELTSSEPAGAADAGELEHRTEPDIVPCTDRRAIEVRIDRALLPRAAGERTRDGTPGVPGREWCQKCQPKRQPDYAFVHAKK